MGLLECENGFQEVEDLNIKHNWIPLDLRSHIGPVRTGHAPQK